MSGLGNTGEWIPLVEFAFRKGVSLSTLRRRIKNNKIEYRVENGRYLVFDSDGEPEAQFDSRSNLGSPHAHLLEKQRLDLQSKLSEVENDLKKAQEEIAELKMLIALYEDKMGNGGFSN